MQKWIEGIREHASPNVVIVVVGNKLDLRKNSELAVSSIDGKKLANSLGVLFAETSAITNENVENTFMLMLEGICPSIQEIQKRKKQESTGSDPRGFQLTKNDAPEQ